MITIKGTQFADNEQDSVELTTVGRLYRRGEAYYICYNESEATGFDGAKTTLKVEGDRRVTMRRTGENMRSQLIIEKGERHQCFYDTGYGAMMLGISGDDIISCLNDSGGRDNSADRKCTGVPDAWISERIHCLYRWMWKNTILPDKGC